MTSPTPAETAAAPQPAAPAVTFVRRNTCRGCGGEALTRVLDLGRQPLANAFPQGADEFSHEVRVPLELYLCGTCGLVQLLHVVDPEVLFRNYIYVTGTSDTIARHNEAYADTVCAALRLTGDDLVVEVASNDGSLLSRFLARGIRALGVEPARNIAELARRRGVDTVDVFFDAARAAQLKARYGLARAVIGNNVLAHVDDPAGFLRGMAAMLAPGGLAIVEVPYLGEMIERLEYDTIYHEHLSYFSVSALLRLCDAAGLAVRRVDRVPVHGGSIRLYAALAQERGAHDPDVLRVAEGEQRAGLVLPARFAQFAQDVAANRGALVALLRRLRAEGKRLAAYGAPAKGNTLLNYCRIGTDLVPFTFDKSPHKVGRFTPGMHLPVMPAESIGMQAVDHLLLLAWNFADEIMEQQSAYRASGGRFIIPIPAPVVL